MSIKSTSNKPAGIKPTNNKPMGIKLAGINADGH